MAVNMWVILVHHLRPSLAFRAMRLTFNLNGLIKPRSGPNNITGCNLE